MAKKGRIRTHHFAHHGESDCDGAWESLVHEKAKEIIKKHGIIYVPDISDKELKIVRFENIQPEIKVGQYTADLLCTHKSGRKLIIEIAVTHPCEEEKVQYYQNKKKNSIEIVLADLPDDFSLKEFEDQVLKISPREWIFNAKLDLLEQARGEDGSAKRLTICKKLSEIFRSLKKVGAP